MQPETWILDYVKQTATDAHKTASKIAIQKTADATGDCIGNKAGNRRKRNKNA